MQAPPRRGPFGVVRIATSDVFRADVAEGTPLWAPHGRAYVDSGEQVPETGL